MKCTYCNKSFKPAFGKFVTYHDKPFCSYQCASQYQDCQIIRKHGMRKYHYGMLAFLLFGICSVIFMNDTHALQYEWSALPLYKYVFPNYESYSTNLQLVYTNSSFVPDGLNIKNPYYFQGTYDSSTGVCSYDTLHSGISLNSDLLVDYTIGGFSEYFPSYNIDSFAMCQLYGHKYADSTAPTYNWNGVWLSQGGVSPHSFKPYWYKFDGIYLKNSAVDTQSGVHYDHRLYSSDLFGVAPGKFRRLVLPLSVNVETVGAIPAGTSLEVKGAITFPGVAPGSGFSFASDFFTSGQVRAYFDGDGAGSDYADCTLTTRSYGDTSGGVSTQIEYSCPIVTSSVNQYYSMSFEIANFGSSGYVWDTDSDWFWSGMYLVTNYDETWAGDLSMDIHASNSDDIPGSATTMFDSDNADWFSSLTNLFNFSIANPFAPIFQMFTDNSDCASIPIIAGMLGSEETTYCPWFDSTTRNVLSPVLGLSSIMLLFGFFVRWLGSSSGNMFEDQTSHKWGNTQIKQKGGK